MQKKGDAQVSLCNLKKNKKGLASCDTSTSKIFPAGAIYTTQKGIKSQPFFIKKTKNFNI